MTTVETLMQEARERLCRCDVESLTSACELYAALSNKPGVSHRALACWAEARAHLARQKLMRGEPWEEEAREALDQAERAVRAAPDEADCQRGLSVALSPFPDQSQRRRAASIRAVELRPDDALNWYERWKALGSRLDDGAIRRALELDPALFGALHDLGIALTEAGRHEPAIKLLTTALNLNPRSAQARYNLAMVLDRAGRSEEADFVLGEAAQLHPGDPLIPRVEAAPRQRRHDYVS